MKLNKVIYYHLIRHYSLYLFSYAALSIVFALILQFFFGLLPCALCNLARFPLYFILILAFFNFVAKRRCERTYIICGVIALFVLAAISFYHAGVEYGLFVNFFDCVSNKNNFENVTELSVYLQNKISTPCDKPLFKFILTLSGWNFFISLALGILGLKHIYLIKLQKNV